jgi:acyl-CoA reductase-like NAD-dependent aldehyde dehydrogenase
LNHKEALAAINALEKSKGWDYVTQVMREEILLSAQRIGENRKMEIDEIHFQRGAIWAAQRLLQIPERLRLRLENEVALGSAKAELKET